MVVTGSIVAAFGWEYGFIASAIGGFIGVVIIQFFVSDTPQSKGLPSIQEISGEEIRAVDKKPTKEIQKYVLKHPAIWIIAISCAFINLTKYGLMEWGVLYLQSLQGPGGDSKFTLETASWIIGFSAIFAIVGTIGAGWLSDTVFKGDRVKPAILSGMLSFIALALFLFTEGGFMMNIFYVSLFSLAVGVLYCIVAGLMAVDIVPRKATGAALGVVGISSYVAAGLQDITSGYLIQYNTRQVGGVDVYDFGPVSWFWLVAALVSFILPVLNWKKMKNN